MDEPSNASAKSEERKAVAARMEVVRAQLRATGATVLTPTAEWTALKKELVLLTRKMR